MYDYNVNYCYFNDKKELEIARGATVNASKLQACFFAETNT